MSFIGFGLMSRIIPFIVFVGFIVVFAIIISRAVQGTNQWSRNNSSPVLTVEAIVVSKRQDVSYYHNNMNDNMHHSSNTNYYITFEVQSGDRMELKTKGSDYGLIVEGDCGMLTFQGTRFLGFVRK